MHFMIFFRALIYLRDSFERYYAAAMMKTLLRLLITKYNSELLNSQKSR